MKLFNPFLKNDKSTLSIDSLVKEAPIEEVKEEDE